MTWEGGFNLYRPLADNRSAVFLRRWQNWGRGLLRNCNSIGFDREVGR